MSQQNKSIPDGVPIRTTAVDSTAVAKNMLSEVPVRRTSMEEDSAVMLEVVSSYPKCGSPVYGCKQVQQGRIPPVQRSCSCVLGVPSVVDTMRTK